MATLREKKEKEWIGASAGNCFGTRELRNSTITAASLVTFSKTNITHFLHQVRQVEIRGGEIVAANPSANARTSKLSTKPHFRGWFAQYLGACG